MSAPETLRDAFIRLYHPMCDYGDAGIGCSQVEALDGIIAAARAESDALRAALEMARTTAMTMLRAERVCEKSHRDGERNAHVHEEVVHEWAMALVPFARAALAAKLTLLSEGEQRTEGGSGK